MLFAGGDDARTILSTVQFGLLPFLSMMEASQLRATCVEARDVVSAFPFDELTSYVPGKVTSWAKAFPKARSLSLRFKADLTDEDFVAVSNLHRIDLYGAELKGPPSAESFVHLSASTLDVSHVVTLRAAAFEHLAHVKCLKLAWCRQTVLDDACLAQLASVVELDLTLCWGARFSDDGLIALAEFGNIRRVAIGGCTQEGITDAGVAALLDAGVVELDVSGCSQITDVAFSHACEDAGPLRALDVSYCPRVSAATIEALRERGVTVTRRRSERETPAHG